MRENLFSKLASLIAFFAFAMLMPLNAASGPSWQAQLEADRSFSELTTLSQSTFTGNFTQFGAAFAPYYVNDTGCLNDYHYRTLPAPTDDVPLDFSICTFAGDYNELSDVVAGNIYKFDLTGGSGNYLTIREGTFDGPVVYAGGSPALVTSAINGSLFMHVNTDSSCGMDSSCHTLIVTCTSCDDGGSNGGGCTNSAGFGGSAAPEYNSLSVQLTSCMWPQEYTTLTDVTAGNQYTFTATTASGDDSYITVREGTFDGPVLGHDYSSVTVTSTDGSDLFVHITLNDSCDTAASGCRTVTAVCDNCPTLEAPSNDEFANAMELTCGDSDSHPDITMATESTEIPLCGSGAGNQDVWYTFTVPAGNTQVYTIAETSLFDAVVSLYKEEDGDYTQLGCDDSPEFYDVMDAGTYYFRVRPYFENPGVKGYVVSLTCEEYVDPCDNKITMECGGGEYTATLTPNSGTWTNYTGTGISYNGSEQVFEFTAAVDGTYTIHMDEGERDADFFLMDACDNFSNNLFGSWHGNGDRDIELTAGTYYLVADLYTSLGETTVTVGITCPDDDGSGCGLEGAEAYIVSDDACLPSQSSMYYIRMEIFGEPGKQYVVMDDQGDVLTYAATSGTYPSLDLDPLPYYQNQSPTFTLYGYDTDAEEWIFDCTVESNKVDAPPLCAYNDDPCGAVQIACNQPITGNMAGATVSDIETDCLWASAAGDVWYSFEADGISDYKLELDTLNGVDVLLAVYSGSSCEFPDLEEYDCTDWYFTGTEEIELHAPAAGIYYVRVLSYIDVEDAEFQLALTCQAPPPTPSNDDPCGAVQIACNQPITGSTAGSTESDIGSECQWSSIAGDVWFSFDADGTSDYTLELDTLNDVDIMLAVYSGVSCEFPDLEEVDCSDMYFYFTESVNLTSPAAGTYFVRVTSYNFEVAAEFELSLTCEDTPPVSCDIGLELEIIADGECLEEGDQFTVVATITGTAPEDYEFTIYDDLGGTWSISATVGSATSIVYEAGESTTLHAVGGPNYDCSAEASFESPGICEEPGEGCLWEVTVSHPSFEGEDAFYMGDQVEWSLDFANGGSLSGGPYFGFDPFFDYASAYSSGAATFMISTDGFFSDNKAYYEIKIDGVVVASGSVEGYDTVYHTDLYCEGEETCEIGLELEVIADGDCLVTGDTFTVVATITGDAPEGYEFTIYDDLGDTWSISATVGSSTSIMYNAGESTTLHAVGGPDYDCSAEASFESPGPCPPDDNVCEGVMYVVQGDNEAQLYKVDNAFNYDPIGAPYPEEYNALGFNGDDGMLYAILNKSSNELLQINPTDGSVINLGSVAGLPFENWNSGVFDNDGNYFVRSRGKSGELYKITDLGGAPTAVEVPFRKGIVNDYDLVYKDGWMFGVDIYGQLFKFDPNDAYNTLTMVGVPNGTGIFGGLAMDSSGRMIALQHRTGGGYTLPVGFYEFDPDTGVAVKLADALNTSFGDMATCANGETTDECDSTIYVVAGDNSEGVLYAADASFNYTAIGTYDKPYNALGFNSVDGQLYGMINKTPGMMNNLLRINKNDGSVENLGAVDGLPESNYNSGVFDGSGNYYVRSSGKKGKFYKIDVTSTPATAVQINFPNGHNTYDLAWNPVDGKMYGVSMHGQMFSFEADDPTGTFMTIGAPSGSGIFGGLMSDSSGRIFGFQHRKNLDHAVGFYAFDTSNGNATKLADAPREINGDMAFCAFGVLDFDCDITLDVEYAEDYDCIEEGDTYVVRISLTGTSPYSKYIISDGEGNEEEMYLGETINMSFPAGVSPVIWADPVTVLDEHGECSASYELTSPEICDDLDELEDPCAWRVRVWSSNNGEGVSWYLKDGNGDIIDSGEDMPASFSHLSPVLNASGPMTFYLKVMDDDNPDAYRSVNYNLFRKGVKIYSGTVRNDIIELTDLMCEGDDRPGLNNPLTDFNFSYYPNPVQDVLHIESAQEVTDIQVFNMIGQQVLSFDKDLKSSNELDMSILEKGVYIVRAVIEGEQVETFKIVKK